MATASREQAARALLRGSAPRKASRPVGSGHAHHPRRAGRYRPPTPTPEELEQREQGWNGRFFRDTPSEPKRPANRRSGQANAALSPQQQKEKKIRDERQQYGAHTGHRSPPPRDAGERPPPHRRLAPLGETLAPLGLPPSEPESTSSKEEKLRFKVLKAIDARETLLYQLNALVLCTPVLPDALAASRPAEPTANNGLGLPPLKPKAKMALAPAALDRSSANNGPMSNAREATRLAQQLATDLQLTGMQCVEALVEWMLVAGANAAKPPVFLWRGQNYFLKMLHDLDFAGPELGVRGVVLDCFTVRNPLCIRPDQRLGRVLAARAIIDEMVEMATQREALDAGASSGRRPLRSPPPPAHAQRQRSGDTAELPNADDAMRFSPVDEPEVAPSADIMISMANDERDPEDEGEASVGMSSPRDNQLVEPLRDDETEHELVGLLDESLAAVPAPDKDVGEVCGPQQSARSSGDEYDQSFDDAASNDEDTAAVAPAKPSDSESARDNQREDEEKGEDAVWQTREAALNDIAASLSPARTALATSSLWSKRNSVETLTSELEQQNSTVLDNSLVGHLTSRQLLQAAHVDRLYDWLRIVASSDAPLHSILWDECVMVADCCSAVVAKRLALAVRNSDSLGSEASLADVLQVARDVSEDPELSDVLLWLQRALVILSHVSFRIRQHECGVSAVIQVLYPYVVQVKREVLASQWHRVVRWLEQDVFGGRVHMDDVRHLMSASVRCLLLNVAYLRRVLARDGEAKEEDDEEEKGIATPVPKLAIVVDRDDIFESSRRAISTSWLAGGSQPLPYHLYPFFKSSFGEKVVNGERVEEGEGRGPLKEWFSLVMAAATCSWQSVSIDSQQNVEVSLCHNRLTTSSPLSAEMLRSGFKIEWRENDNGRTVASRILNAQTDAQTFSLDRSVGEKELSLRLTDVTVYAPHAALLEYQKATETWWLATNRNASGADDQQRYEFLGAVVANALLHFCALNVRMHPLLLSLLLDPERSISLDDVRVLDPSLFDALEQMRRMKPSEFGSVLEFEGLAPSLSVDEYIAHTLAEHFGPASYVFSQLQAMRRGFQRFYLPIDRQQAGVSGTDLSVVLAAGDNGGDIEIETLFQVSLDPDLTACEPLRRAFWQTVRAFSPALKRKLLKFITGVDTLPQPGTEFLRIEMPFPSLSAADHAKTLLMLPQSHTCDNTLELPHYWRALQWKAESTQQQVMTEQLETELRSLLHGKLTAAIEYSSGYGLDGTSAVPNASLGGLRPAQRAATPSAAHESYDSLDLPALGEDASDPASGLQLQPGNDEFTSRNGDMTSERPLELSAKPPTETERATETSGPKEDESYAENDWEEEELAG
ncbi:hypothetical protein ATCC90586_002234 [Pythium insidiosum]|nr:hypothetical protein ATCC90586_002234 [Pythium insidiosum]